MNVKHFKLSLSLMRRVRDKGLLFDIGTWIPPHYNPFGYVFTVGGYMMMDLAHNKLGLVQLDGYPRFLGTGSVGFDAITDFWQHDSGIVCLELSYANRPDLNDVITRMQGLLSEFLKVKK